MAKYIIDIPDEHELDWINKSSRLGFELCFPINETATNKQYYIPTGLKLEPYTEPGRKAIEDEVWEFIRKFCMMEYGDIRECYKEDYWSDIFEKYTYSEAKAKYESWKVEREKIRVGDEVEYEVCGKVVRFVVLKIYNEVAYGFKYPFDRANIDDYCGIDTLKKTGRHFDEVEKLLERMKSE